MKPIMSHKLEQELKTIENRIAEIREELKKESKVWEPKCGDVVWRVEGNGVVVRHTYSRRIEKYYLMGMLFQTKQEAEKARDRQLAKVRIIRALREHECDWVGDWSEIRQGKRRVYYDHSSKNLGVTGNRNCQEIESEMYSNREACEWVIDNMQDDLKLYFGVE